MLYLIGGAPRAGKSTLAERMLADHRIAYCSLDFIADIFHNGVADLGIRHELPYWEKAPLMWKHTSWAICSLAHHQGTYLLEGDALLPSDVAGWQEFRGDTGRSCFIGYADADPAEKLKIMRSIPSATNDWVAGETDEEVAKWIAYGIDYSRYLRDECAKHDLPYFDTSHDFDGAVEAARAYLLEES